MVKSVVCVGREEDSEDKESRSESDLFPSSAPAVMSWGFRSYILLESGTDNLTRNEADA